ncbi:MAG: LPS-assembly protein LptD [Desulfobacterales bacterium]|nr:LPS-assembly protein LptD [Desulfobacterales bacterium]
MFSRGLFRIFFFVVVLWSSSTPLLAYGKPDIAYHVKADSLGYDDGAKTYRARGHVSITRADQSLSADAIDFNTETKEAEARGNVRFFSGQDWLTGTRIEMNLDEGIGTVYDGTLFIKENHFYVRGRKIEKTGKDSYYVNAGRFTSCDGDRPAWEITGRDLSVRIEGYGTIKHAALRVKSVPVLYIPYVVFPAKIKRQSGFLVPLLHFSDRDGFEYSQPFFWAISESSDATFYERYMEYRGFKHGVEYRYVLDPASKGSAMYDSLLDRQTGSSEERWWFRMKSDQRLPAGFKAKLDVDVVSDENYLREFYSGYSGLEENNAYFREAFGRELDDPTDTVRLNQLNLNRSWDQFSLNADFRWYDDVIKRKNSLPDDTQQNLPSVKFTGSKQKISDTPFYFDLEASFDRFWRRDLITATQSRGYRSDLCPRVYYPVTLFRYFDFEPSVGVRETLWKVEEYGPGSTTDDDQLRSREIYDLKGDLSTELSRVFDLRVGKIDKVRHAIRPQVTYEYVPNLEQEDLPDFVAPIVEKNLVTCSLTNNFTARTSQRPKPDAEAELESEQQQGSLPPKYGYHDFCRIKFTQSYDIIEAGREENGEEKRPFSDLKGELEFKVSRFVDIEADAAWSPYDAEFQSYNAIAMLRDNRGDWGSVDYRYTRDSSRSILSKIFVKLLDPVSVYWENELNLKDGQEVKSILGFQYESQCWSLNVRYTRDRAMDEEEYLVEIGLHGMGNVGL